MDNVWLIFTPVVGYRGRNIKVPFAENPELSAIHLLSLGLGVVLNASLAARNCVFLMSVFSVP